MRLTTREGEAYNLIEDLQENLDDLEKVLEGFSKSEALDQAAGVVEHCKLRISRFFGEEI